LQRYLIEAMSRLMASCPAWRPNTEKSRVWHAQDGLFLVWPGAAHDIRKALEDDQIVGMPTSAEAMLDILTAAGLVETRAADAPLWLIEPPGTGAQYDAVKLASGEILLAGLPGSGSPNSPLAQTIVVRSNPARSGTFSARGPASEPGAMPQTSAVSASTIAPEPAQRRPPDIRLVSPPSPAAPTADGSPPPPPQPTQASLLIKLEPPMKLSPRVRDVLAQAIDSLNHDPQQALACRLPSGFFVPLECFMGAGVDTPFVLRALKDAAMSPFDAASGRLRVVEHALHGEPVLGVVIKAEFVSGLDAGAP
jgi:conjugal transfer pilus assembly protein TraI